MTSELIRYNAMCRAIAEAFAVDEVKDIRDKAAALEHYARQARNTEAERQCAEIRLRAERRAGQLLKKTEKAKGARGNPGGRGAPIVRSDAATTQTLAELGITKDQSSQWQKLADVPEAEFEAVLARRDKPTLSAIIKAGRSTAVERDGAAAARLSLWAGHFDDYDGLLPQTPPAEVARTMTPETRDDLVELLPRIVHWLMQVERELSDA